MRGRACCVSGHRNLPEKQREEIALALEREIDEAVREGYRCFLSGFAEGADLLFARKVLERQRICPEIELVAVIPYRRRWERLRSGEETGALLAGCAEVIVVEEEYSPGVYARRNRYMAEHSERVIAVYDGREKGGTAGMLREARRLKRELRIIALGAG